MLWFLSVLSKAPELVLAFCILAPPQILRGGSDWEQHGPGNGGAEEVPVT